MAVCFLTVACLAITSGIAGCDAIQIVAPQFTISNYKFERYQSNEAFKRSLGSCGDKENKPALTEEELTKKRKEDWSLALRGEQHEGAQSLVRMLIIILVSVVIYFVHWRIARRARESAIS